MSDLLWIPISQSPPTDVQLRLWVQLLNGREVEIHGFYTSSGQWDIGMAWKTSILRIMFWQPVYPPYTPTVATPSQTKNWIPDLSPQLNVYTVFPFLHLYWTYTPAERQIAWVESNRFIQQRNYKIPLEMMQKFMKPEHRQAALWLWAYYGTNPIEAIIDPQLRMSYLDLYQWQTVLLSTYRVFLFNLGTELTSIFMKLSSIKVTNETLEQHIAFLTESKDKIFKFGNDILQSLYQNIAYQVQDLYNQEKYQWISAYGSRWLTYLVKMGYPSEELYAKERATKEFPKFTLVPSGTLHLTPYQKCVPPHLIDAYASYLYSHDFMWYSDTHGNLVLAKLHYLKCYVLYRRFSNDAIGNSEPY